MRRYIFGLIAIFISIVGVVAQPPIPDPAGRWVIDDAGVLSERMESTISLLCQNEFDSTTNQVVVYIFKSLEGATIESYANEVFTKWKIGSEEKKNGVLLIIAIDDRNMRIEVGYGLEPYLTDLEAKDIIDSEISPEFKKGDFDQGVLNGVQAILPAIQMENIQEPINKNPMNGFISLQIVGLFFIFVISFIGGIFFLFIYTFVKHIAPGIGVSGKTGGSSGNLWSSKGLGGSMGGIKFKFGGSGFGSGGGGFRGGGGSSGGGGASGRW